MRKRQESRDPTVRSTILAFALVVLAFITATLVSQLQVLENHKVTEQLLTTTAPGIYLVDQMRREIWRLETLIDDYSDSGRPVVESRVAIMSALRALRATGESYFSLQASSEDAVFRPGIRTYITDLTGMVETEWNVDVQGRGPSVTKSFERKVRRKVEDFDTDLTALAESQAVGVHRLTQGIEQRQRRSMFYAVLLDIVSVLMTILAAMSFLRVLRRYNNMREERTRELEQFAVRVAHDVLSPMAAGSQALQSVDRDVVGSMEIQKIVDSGREALRSGKAVVEGLLQFARAGARPLPGASCDACQVAEQVIDQLRPMAARKGITLLPFSGETGRIAVNEGLLVSLLSNLIQNSIRYMGERPPKLVEVRGRCEGDQFRLEVEDTGPGFSPEKYAAIFEPYVRGQDHDEMGLGLGLATVRKIVEAHRGLVGVRSRVGNGACFWVWLPLTKAEKSPPVRG